VGERGGGGSCGTEEAARRVSDLHLTTYSTRRRVERETSDCVE